MPQDPEAIKAGEKKTKTQDGVQCRKKQAKDTTAGEQVWYSRRVDDGCQLHWAIITHGKKYELRLPDGVPSKEKVLEDQKDSTLKAPREYEDRVVSWSLKEEMSKLRALNLTKPGAGHTRDYTVCQIGWTTLAKHEVDAEWEAARKALEVETLGFDNCRELLKSFARIIKKPEGCALDYDWFVESLEIPSHRLHEIPPEKVIKSFQQMLQESKWVVGAGAGAGAGIVYGAYEAGGYMNSSDGHGGNIGVPTAGVEGACVTLWCFEGACSNCGDCGWLLCIPCAGGAC